MQLKGITIKKINIEVKQEGDDIQGSYALMSDNDKVLAKQSFNGYADIKVTFSSDTMKKYNEFMAGVKQDINAVLGFTEEGA